MYLRVRLKNAGTGPLKKFHKTNQSSIRFMIKYIIFCSVFFNYLLLDLR